MQPERKLVWIDLEMTGLNPSYDVILEIATIITDGQLNIIAKGPSLVIYQQEEALNKMSEIVKNIHTKSGLINAVRNSSTTLAEAERLTLEFIKRHSLPYQGLLAGNSVWNDRNFIAQYMPKLKEYLNYRLIDVTSVKELINQWYPTSTERDFVKPENHRALEDIEYSIAELAHYKKYFFI